MERPDKRGDERPPSPERPPSQLAAFAATFTWINVWLFFPFATFGALLKKFGPVHAFTFWGALGLLAPQLKQRDSMRRFLAKMSYWVDGQETVGSMDRGKPVIHCHHPHGQVAVSACAQGSKHLQVRAVAAPAVFRIPLCRQLMELIGTISSEKHAFQKHLKSGQDLAVIPGGVEEVVLADQTHERLYLNKRKGFIKYALQYGYDLVPLYHLGETQLFYVLWPFTTEWGIKLRLWIAEKTQVALGIGIGWPWMPNLPKRGKKCILLIGERMVLPKVENPTAEDVQKYHTMYVERLVELYNKNRHRVPEYVGKDLEIW